MDVIIKEREYEYFSDHPVGWKRSKGDFKFPVSFGHNKCFIKRFNKRTESISGWQLLVNLKGKNAPGLPRIHDIVTTVERDETVNYLFLEFIEGETLGKLLAERVHIDLEKLTGDLISAFESINKYDFWFADFFEKNICSDRRGNFYLVDLDSAQHISRRPDRDMWGEKEYWGLVFDFYKKVLKKQNFQPSDLNGLFLNYLQLIFLILRIKIYGLQKNREKEYNEILVYPSQLEIVSPAFRQVFEDSLVTDPTGNTGPLVKQIKELIREFIIKRPEDFLDDWANRDDHHHIEDSEDLSLLIEPFIKVFSVSNAEETDGKFIVESGSEFELTWKVENASDIQLYRNGQFFKTIEDGVNRLELSEKVYDREQKEIEFELIASNSGEVVSEKLTVLISIQKMPAIISFRLDNYVEKNGSNYIINNGEPFTISWEVENAAEIKLYRNGQCINETTRSRSEMELTEKLDNKNEGIIKFRLEAANRAKATTSSLTVQVKELAPPPVPEPKEVIVPDPPKPKLTIPTEQRVRLTVENFKSRSATDNYTVVSGAPFRLRWLTENVTDMGLLRNGKPVQFNPADGFLELRETAGGQNPGKVQYTLVGTSDDEIQRDTVYITAKKPLPVNLIMLVAGLVILAIIGIFGYKIFTGRKHDGRDSTPVVHHPEPTKLSITQLTLARVSEGDTLTFSGTSLPENDHSIVVKFNDGTEGTISQQDSNGLRVVVPHLNTSVVNIKAIVNGINEFILASNVPYTAKAPLPTTEALVKVFPKRQLSLITEGENLSISGENLPKNAGTIEVTFNDISGRIVSQNAKRVTVEVPKLPAPKLVDIEMIVNGKFFFVAEGVKYDSIVPKPSVNTGKVTLNPFSQEVITEGENITITGSNIPVKPGAVQVIFDGRVLFPIVEQTSTLIRARVPTLVLRSGILAVKANGNFIPLQNSLVNYKLSGK